MMPKIKNIALYSLFIFAGALIGFWAFDRVAMTMVVGSGKAFPIPNLVGMNIEDAEREATSNGFRFKIIKEEFSTTIPENRVLSQIPKAASLAQKERMIRVAVSKGGIKVVVPNIVGQILRQAEIAIEEAGLLIGQVDQQFCDSIIGGKVISTTPAAGETIAAGTKLDLVVSMGSETAIVYVPNLVGMQSNEACKTLNSIGLKCAIVKRRIPTIANGEVFKQEPAPGTQLYRGNCEKGSHLWRRYDAQRTIR